MKDLLRVGRFWPALLVSAGATLQGCSRRFIPRIRRSTALRIGRPTIGPSFAAAMGFGAWLLTLTSAGIVNRLVLWPRPAHDPAYEVEGASEIQDRARTRSLNRGLPFHRPFPIAEPITRLLCIHRRESDLRGSFSKALTHDATYDVPCRGSCPTPRRSPAIIAAISARSSSRAYDSDPKPLCFSSVGRFNRSLCPVAWANSCNAV